MKEGWFIQDSFNPTAGLQESTCPKCGKRIQYYLRQTWADHIQFCKGRPETSKPSTAKKPFKLQYDQRKKMVR